MWAVQDEQELTEMLSLLSAWYDEELVAANIKPWDLLAAAVNDSRALALIPSGTLVVSVLGRAVYCLVYDTGHGYG